MSMHAPVNPPCDICGNSVDLRTIEVREMMFGTGNVYRYLHCLECCSLHYADHPLVDEEQYPRDYYAHVEVPAWRQRLTGWLEGHLASYSVNGRNVVGAIIHRLRRNTAFASLKRLGLKKHHRILDVGCGNGRLVHALFRAGFPHVYGADLFLSTQTNQGNGPTFFRSNIEELVGTYDVIMFHHSFEHLENPRRAVLAAERLLEDGGVCLIATPNLESDAWREYGASWVQIDAPRHYHILSEATLARLTEGTQFAMEHVSYDSTAFQFWASDMYRHGVPLYPPPLVQRRAHRRPTQCSLRFWNLSRRASILNREGVGDQFVAYLRKGSRIG